MKVLAQLLDVLFPLREIVIPAYEVVPGDRIPTPGEPVKVRSVRRGFDGRIIIFCSEVQIRKPADRNTLVLRRRWF